MSAANYTEIHIPLPRQSLERHSLFDLHPDAVADWLRTLPSANLGETTRQLYLALVELNKVKCSPKDRLLILEQIRHLAHVANRGLEKHFLNQPVILPERSRKVAQLADTLNKQMAIGYSLCANQFLSMHRLRRPKDQLAMAFHRAITEHSLVLLRNFQLYRNEEPGFWKTIHELFYQALKHKISREKVDDELWGNGTLEQCYLRPMLLFTARPHQLRQTSQADVFTALSQWSQNARVRGDQFEQCVFLFKPTRDAPPVYRELCEDTSGWLGIDAKALCKALEHQLTAANEQSKPAAEELTPTLLQHLHSAWSMMQERKSVRVDRNDELLISLGLFSTHFFASGEEPFSEYMQEGSKASEMVVEEGDFRLRKRFDPDRDAWAEANQHDVNDKDQKGYTPPALLSKSIDFEPRSKQAPTPSTRNYRYYKARMVNASERGYCINWPPEESVKLQTGDVVGLRERNDRNWGVGVIRWVKQISATEHQLGLEVLARVADTYSARLVRTGLAVGEYQRALMLPPDRESGLPERILIQKSAFREGDAIELRRPGQTTRIKLQSCVVQTLGVGTYLFSTMVRADNSETDQRRQASPAGNKTLDPLNSGQHKNKPEFDTLWKDL
ncbi:hypothetical protein FHR99_002816 [Litorivivens lipolytica]|uniref:GTPase n=1 Tax=Litorivivens lipolytica TaxID=1524264 RepID=A0A7W4Z6T1_9GAMM|nr:hypothetical protein [Litorivivens lipolytica]MBB3048542.1 hypothetical protein [Litorivivens lipolytica]